MSRRIQGILPDDTAELFAIYLAANDLKEGEAVRIAIDRLLASEPKKSERLSAKSLRPGNPNLKRTDKG